MIALVLGQLFGLVRNILIAGAFDAGSVLDPYLAANRVAETLFNLVAGGALSSAFIPIFTGFLVKDDRKSAWKVASGVGNLVALSMSVLALIAAIFAPQIVRYLLASGFADDPAREQLTVHLLRIMLPIGGPLRSERSADGYPQFPPEFLHPGPCAFDVFDRHYLSASCFLHQQWGWMASPGVFYWVPVCIC